MSSMVMGRSLVQGYNGITNRSPVPAWKFQPFERDLPAAPASFLDALGPFRDGIVVGCECMFAWYWLADVCEDNQLPFVLGHALYMKAIHGGGGCLPASVTFGIELVVLPGQHVARRGFWDMVAVGGADSAEGRTPYSCLAPPRFTTFARVADEWTLMLNHPGAVPGRSDHAHAGR